MQLLAQLWNSFHNSEKFYVWGTDDDQANMNEQNKQKAPERAANPRGYEGLVVKKRRLNQILIEMVSLYAVISSMLVKFYKFINLNEN